MFLRASSNAIDTEPETGDIMTDSGGDANVPAGVALLDFTAAAHRLDDTLPGARDALVEAVGHAGMVDAAVTAAVFRGLNIAADTSGIRVDDDWVDTAKDLMTTIGTGRFRTSANSPAVST